MSEGVIQPEGQAVDSSSDGSEENQDSNVSASGAGEGSGDIQDALSAAINELEPKDDESDDSESKQELSEKEIRDLKKKLKLKVYGKEIEDELDWNDEDGLKKRLQKSHAFDHVSQDLSKLKSEVSAFMQELQSNPIKILSDLGLNFDDMAEKRIEELVEEAKKSPEQIAKEKMEKELKDLKEKLAKEEEQKQQAQLEKLRNEQAAIIESDIQDALENVDTVLPKKSPWVLKKVAETMLMAMQNGYPQVTAKEVIPFVEDQFKNDLKGMFDIFPEEVIERVVGKNNIDRMRKKRLKSKPANTQTARQMAPETGKKVESNNNDEASKKSYKDFFSKLD